MMEWIYVLHCIFRLKKTLEQGVEKGYWNLVTGNPSSGTYELAMEEFDPTDGRFFFHSNSDGQMAQDTVMHF